MVEKIFEIDKAKQGTKVNGVQIIDSYEDQSYKNAICIINTRYFEGIEQNEIILRLSEIGINKFYSLTEYEKEQIVAESYYWTDKNRLRYYRCHENDLIKIFGSLYDVQSKNIMNEYIRTYVECGVYSLPQCNGMTKYFYGFNIDDKYEQLYEHIEEVWMNCGSNIGDNIFCFWAAGLSAKKIYAYEGERINYSRLCKNIQYLPDEIKSKCETHNIYIDENIDFSHIKEKVSLINADIEIYHVV